MENNIFVLKETLLRDKSVKVRRKTNLSLLLTFGENVLDILWETQTFFICC